MPTVRANGIDAFYERCGAGPPVVFVHGAVMDHAQWAPQTDALADDYEVIAYDVRGHGRTGESERERYSVDLFADDLAALLDALDLDRPVLWGHSMGGCIAQAFAARRPDRVAGLVLADTLTPTLFSRSEWIQRSLLLRATVPPVRLVGYERVERALVWLQERLSGPGVSGDYDRVRQSRAAGPTLSTDEFARVIRAVARFHETRVDLSAIAAPTLVLYGEQDAPFVRRHADRFRAEISDCVVREVPDAGHASNLDNPEAFTAAVRAFLVSLLEAA